MHTNSSCIHRGHVQIGNVMFRRFDGHIVGHDDIIKRVGLTFVVLLEKCNIWWWLHPRCCIGEGERVVHGQYTNRVGYVYGGLSHTFHRCHSRR